MTPIIFTSDCHFHSNYNVVMKDITYSNDKSLISTD